MAHALRTTAQSQGHRRPMPPWLVQLASFTVAIGVVALTLQDLFHLWVAYIVAITAVVLAVYMAPTFVAFKRRHRNRKAIAALNIFLGWSFIAWVIALVWSFTADIEVP
jgi:hypothetical protein